MRTCLIQNQISIVHILENMQLEFGNVLLKIGSCIKAVEPNATGSGSLYLLDVTGCTKITRNTY
jgi:hypothetical protein